MNDIRLKCNSVSCNNENHLCEVKYEILQCSNKNKYEIYQIGNNKISNVIKFAEEHKFRELVDNDNFFVFGGDFGSGTDDDHFQLGYTS
jgi:hypothetical protein